MREGDVTVLGVSESLGWFRGVVQQRMDVKFEGRQGEVESRQELNRIATLTEHGLEYQADQRHLEILMKDMGSTTRTRSCRTRDEYHRRAKRERSNEE